MKKHRLHRLKTQITQILLFSVLCSLFSAIAQAQPVPSQELISNAKTYDAKQVVYEGEVIGDVMRRGKFSWVNINDGGSAIGVWLDSRLADGILYTGSYEAKGDWLEVTGILNRACVEHGGDLDLHAFSIRRITPGREIKERLNLDKKNLAVVLLGVLFIVWILSLLKRR